MIVILPFVGYGAELEKLRCQVPDKITSQMKGTIKPLVTYCRYISKFQATGVALMPPLLHFSQEVAPTKSDRSVQRWRTAPLLDQAQNKGFCRFHKTVS